MLAWVYKNCKKRVFYNFVKLLNNKTYNNLKKQVRHSFKKQFRNWTIQVLNTLDTLKIISTNSHVSYHPSSSRSKFSCTYHSPYQPINSNHRTRSAFHIPMIPRTSDHLMTISAYPCLFVVLKWLVRFVSVTI